MKAKLYVCVFLTALIAVFTISGCTEESTMVDKLAASTDEVIANVIENVHDETGTTTTAVTTVAPTETTVGETTTAPEVTTEAEEVAETKTNQTSDKATASNTDKTENNASATTQKPNNTSNSNTSGNTTTNKPSSNTNGNTSGNTSKPKPVETQVPTTEAPVVITDDTPLPYEQIGTEENMQRMVDDCIEYFTSLGMTYNEELDPSWSGWYYGHQGGLSYTDVRSYNETSERNIIGIKEQVDAVLINYAGYEYTDITFKPCYELTDRGTYSIIFCYG